MTSLTPQAAPWVAGRSDPDWLTALRRGAFEVFQRDGLPGRRNEAWKYTNLERDGATLFDLAPPPGPEATVPLPGAIRLFNGFLTDPLPVSAGVGVGRIDAPENAALVMAHLGRGLSAADHPLAALNGALFADGLVVHVGAGATIEAPIDLVSFAQAGASPLQFHTRLLVVVEAGASATLVERHGGIGRTFSNHVTEIVLAPGATLTHLKVQDESAEATHVAATAVSLGEDSTYDSVVVQLGGRLARNEVHGTLLGDKAAITLAGVALAGDGQHLDNTTRIVHRGLGTRSDQLFKTVLGGAGHGVFLGTVTVGEGADGTDARQLSRALMLSEKAAMDCKPELEIFTDDVKCSHGATIGDIDEDALFYLRSRGLDAAAARRLLIEAFLGEVVDRIAPGSLHDMIAEAVTGRLARLVGEAS
jgi:Fe-S cluster assembly protein SufD